MTDVEQCPKCGAEVPTGGGKQPCAACLMQLGLESWDGPADDAGGPTQVFAGGFEAPTIEELAPYFLQFELLDLVGKGGMGAVYKARQKSLDRVVAVKIINPSAAGQPGFAERFAREARAMARMNHPNIVTIHDFGSASAPSSESKADGESPPLYYLVMEYVEGTNLRPLLRAGALAPRDALAIIPPLCDALQYAHDEGIVHRDIKPENILIDKKGRVKIADFGLAKLLARTPRDITLTENFQALGTMHYMAPEQLERPLEVDHRADIYALGVTLYEMLTGELPIGRFAPPSQKVPVDVRLDEIVLRALDHEPELRYQQASEVKTAVESCVSRPAPEQFAPASAPPIPKWLRAPAYGLISYGGMLLVLVGMYIIGSMVQWQDEGQDVVLREVRELGPIILTGMVLSVPIGILAIVAGMRMLASRSRGLIVTASILSMLPLSPVVFGFPIGIWVLIVLNRWDVKAAFARSQRDRDANVPHLAAPHHPLAVYSPGAGPRMLALALGFTSSALVAAMGAALLIYGLAAYPAGESQWSGFVGAGFGSLVGGLGGFLGCWNKLRTMRGRIDLMYEAQWNWLDSVLVVYALAGIAALFAGAIWWPSLNIGLRIAAIVLGGIATFQGFGFSAWRLGMRRAAKQESAQPTLDLRLILVAVGMLVCAILMICGIAVAAIAAVKFPFGSGEFWGWIGSAFGFLLGGGGGLLGTWNSYRSLEGLPDWMADAKINTFDHILYAFGGLGALMMLSGLIASPWISNTSVYALELLGGILLFQTAIFFIIRSLLRRGGRQEADQNH